jgi:ubiquinone/menaquinone biosynthesis C-methylase UbiE
MTDSDAYIRKGVAFDPLIEPTVNSAIQALQLPSGSHGLDAGCGIGLQALLLAAAIGPTGHVTGVDISPEFLLYAEEAVRKSCFSDRVSFRVGDVSKLSFDNAVFDWAWSSCCVGYAASLNPMSTVKELSRVVKPGGRVAIFAWSSEKLLPGYPLLEARLGATASGIAPFATGRDPELHFSRALGWFREAGLVDSTAQTFSGCAHAPLNDDIRCALIDLIEMRWPEVESELTKEDRLEYERLCLPESPEFILNHSDYYAFFTCSMFHGTVAT